LRTTLTGTVAGWNLFSVLGDGEAGVAITRRIFDPSPELRSRRKLARLVQHSRWRISDPKDTLSI
jgi:hypothetical protein